MMIEWTEPIPWLAERRRRSRRAHAETLRPGERAHLAPRRQVAAYALAVVAPLAVAAALIPLRAAHGRTLAIVLVLPVVLVASLGAAGPSALAAVTAGASYDLLLTAPFYRPVIDDPDDVTAAVTLLAVGLLVGAITSRATRLRASDLTRRGELDHLVRYSRLVASGADPDELADRACQDLSDLLHLRHCRWYPRHQPSGDPVLLPDGNVMGYRIDLKPDRARLPTRAELPAIHRGRELGRFLLTPDPDRLVSHEERLTAATIAGLYAYAVARQV
jgi:K+-sensing histidine kinase KdpD